MRLREPRPKARPNTGLPARDDRAGRCADHIAGDHEFDAPILLAPRSSVTRSHRLALAHTLAGQRFRRQSLLGQVLTNSGAALLRQLLVVVIAADAVAGVGIAGQICRAMLLEGLSTEDAARRFWMVDLPGLLTADMPDELKAHQTPYARPASECRAWRLESVESRSPKWFVASGPPC